MATLESTMNRVVAGLQSQGARIVRKKKGWQVRCPNGQLILMHVTPSDHRALLNIRSHVRRCGLRWPLDK